MRQTCVETCIRCAPTVLRLQARIDELEAEVKALQGLAPKGTRFWPVGGGETEWIRESSESPKSSRSASDAKSRGSHGATLGGDFNPIGPFALSALLGNGSESGQQ